MLNRFKSLPLIIASLTLTACVSVDSKREDVSNALHDVKEPESCQAITVVNNKDIHEQGLNPENIALLNWNLYKGNNDGWQKDLSSFAQSHDVMTIQEAYLDDELSGLLQTNNFNWTMNTAFHLNGTAAGVMTVANSKAIQSCGFQNIEPIIRVPKATLVSYYNIDGHDRKLLVANIHGINFTLGVTAYQEQLAQLFDSIQHHDGPMIVAGDFNTWSDDRMAEVMQLVEKLSMSSLEYRVNNKTHVFGNAIDHVFYRQLQPVSKKVWQVSSSDHNPISVTFKLKPEARLIAVREIPEACADSC
jgi:endonuclease/exonuclease/phosphatase (EEP) superfamily protein YafD